MPPPPAAREKVLDAFQRLLIEHGERETTLDAVARAAGVSWDPLESTCRHASLSIL